MDTNECDANRLDADVLLPPRKRLLAGLKKQRFSETTSQYSHENNRSPLSPNPLSQFDLRLDELLKSYKNGSKMSPLEIADAARSKAARATKAAEAARAAAEEKAAIAAKAVAAAKTTLDSISLIPEEFDDNRDKNHTTNKLNKHVQSVEGLARRLNRAMNRTQRISKHSSGSKYKNYKHKRLKILPPSEKNNI